MSNVNSIGPIQGADGPQKGSKSQRIAKDKYPSFKDTLNGVMKEVNDMQSKADASIQKMAAGEITDVHQVMNSVQEANLAFNMMMEIRNKVLDAYQEIMRMRL